jgi:hypothetical protein
MVSAHMDSWLYGPPSLRKEGLIRFGAWAASPTTTFCTGASALRTARRGVVCADPDTDMKS